MENKISIYLAPGVCQGPSPNRTRRKRKKEEKSHPEKSSGNLGLGELPKFLGFPYNISATAVVSDFKFGAQLGFAKAHHKITRRRKDGCGSGLGSSPKFWGSPIIFLQRLGLATSNSARSCGLPRPIIKSHAEEREGMALG